MTDDRLCDLLSQWHAFASSSRVARGYASLSAGFGQYRPAAVWDDENGADDALAHAKRMTAVGRCIMRLGALDRVVIGNLARNLHDGVELWACPPLPEKPGPRMIAIAQAKVALAELFKREGIE